MSEEVADSAPNSPFSCPRWAMFPDCILVSVTEPQSHLAWAQAPSFPIHKRERSHKRAERSAPFAGRVESKGGDHGLHQHSAVGKDTRQVIGPHQ